jgi:predicted PurR-regulated permease PerM
MLMIPDRYCARVAEAVDATGNALRAWLLGQLLSMTFTGVLITIGLLAIGVPSALALGLIAGLMGFVPMIGPLIGAAPGVLVALTIDRETLLMTILLYFVVQQLAGSVVEPLIMQRAVKLPPALTLFALFGTGTLFGVVGVLLGGPLLVLFYVMTRHLYVRGALGHSLAPASDG